MVLANISTQVYMYPFLGQQTLLMFTWYYDCMCHELCETEVSTFMMYTVCDLDEKEKGNVRRAGKTQ